MSTDQKPTAEKLRQFIDLLDRIDKLHDAGTPDDMRGAFRVDVVGSQVGRPARIVGSRKDRLGNGILRDR